jgi:hypothetical protein
MASIGGHAIDIFAFVPDWGWYVFLAVLVGLLMWAIQNRS